MLYCYTVISFTKCIEKRKQCICWQIVNNIYYLNNFFGVFTLKACNVLSLWALCGPQQGGLRLRCNCWPGCDGQSLGVGNPAGRCDPNKPKTQSGSFLTDFTLKILEKGPSHEIFWTGFFCKQSVGSLDKFSVIKMPPGLLFPSVPSDFFAFVF